MFRLDFFFSLVKFLALMMKMLQILIYLVRKFGGKIANLNFVAACFHHGSMIDYQTKPFVLHTEISPSLLFKPFDKT